MIADVRALTFETVDEAERFYCAYSAVVGFGCRKDDKGESNGLIRWRQWVCCKEGTRGKKYLEADGLSRTPRKQTRVNCQARFRINYNDGSRVYMVKIFVPEHNHELATGNQIAFVRAHRHVSDAALALTNTMTRVSIRPCHTYEFMVEQAGGYSVVGFTMKDLYNKLDQQRRTSPFESDSEGALSYMRALAAKDPHFICRFTTDLEDRPLVLFVGSNNHRGSIIFGAALISDETEETYTWLLRTFLESMNGKMPKAVLTNSDEAMRKEMIDVLDLHDDIWIGNMYEKRDKFCQAFFGDIFMAGMRSTQRCEGMNKEFKRVLGKGKSFVELVALVYRLLMKLRHNQERDEFINMNSFPGAVTHLVDLEIQASSIFTHDVFKLIVREIKKESFITLKQGAECHEDGSRVYKVSVYKRPEFDHTVVYHPEKEADNAEDPIMVCSCRMFQYRGVPCHHMFTVMKNEHIFELQKSLIVKRWSKDARTVCEIPYPDQSMPREALVSRYGALTAECNRLCFYASKTDAGYNMLQKEISRLSSIVEGFAKEKEKVQAPATPSNMKGNVVRDLVPFRTKGREKNDKKTEAPRRPITCGYCQGIGHNSQTCNVRKEKEKAEKRNENDERNTDPHPLVATPAKRSCGYCKRSGHNTQTCDVRKEKEKAEKTNENVTGTSNDPPPSYRALCTNSERSLSALWGKLAAEILMQNWDIALEELN
ncbi:PREDICTED: protein FAR-RED IMPAIRED RESPONSE 1-like [Fragaria vesca subsp. vesca]|uniref:protein FAR-RED IMPAIRED RESPONSE 1-like n=1 Tax=Fragaria vesca subsp. vesca TaxID=101020 RepID=UPI0002C3786D|nr:PREDICTED: protein FAR-RED IMPAIRED RESPONSE 1-like [Fragaria vesca subsp. vesca]